MSKATFTDWIFKKPIIAEYLAVTKQRPTVTKVKQPSYNIENIPSIVTENISQEIQEFQENTIADTDIIRRNDIIADTDTVGGNDIIADTIRRNDHLIECTADILKQKQYSSKLYPFLCQEVEPQQLPGLVALGMDVNEMFNQVCIQGKNELFTPLVHLGAVPGLEHFGLTNSIPIFNELICTVPVDTTNEVTDSVGCNVMEKWIEKGPKLPLYAIDFGFKGNQRCLERAIDFGDDQLVTAFLQQGVPVNRKIQQLANMSNDTIKMMISVYGTPMSW